MKPIRSTTCLLFVLMVGFQCLSQHQDLYAFKTFIRDGDTLNYRMLYPKDFSKDKQYPLVCVLHGAGERGPNNTSQLAHGSALFAANREAFPAVVIFPQCPSDDYWANAVINRATQPLTISFVNGGEPTKALGMVMALLDGLVTEPFVASQHVYVGGLSMGGMGTFEILSRRPTMFAAAFAICGGGHTESATAYARTTDLWIFHGAHDDVVSPQQSIAMVSAILNEGGHPHFTLYGDDNHNSWDSAFAEPNLLPWLFSKSKQ